MKILPVASALISLGVSARAGTYDMSGGFSLSQNSPSSTWAYAYNTSGAHSNYTLLPLAASVAGKLGALVVPATSTTWQISNVSYPCWYRSGSTMQICNNANKNMAIDTFLAGSPAVDAAIITPAKSIVMRPPTTGLAVVSFLVPASGSATVNYAFMANDYSCALPGSGLSYSGSYWSIDHNATVATQGSLVTRSPFAYASTGTMNIEFPVVAGDRINFTVAANDGNANCAGTALTATIVISN